MFSQRRCQHPNAQNRLISHADNADMLTYQSDKPVLHVFVFYIFTGGDTV